MEIQAIEKLEKVNRFGMKLMVKIKIKLFILLQIFQPYRMQYTVVPQPGTEQKVSFDEFCDLDLPNPKTKLNDDELKIWKNKK